MSNQECLNIYIEQIVPEKSIEEVWKILLHSKEFSSLFINGLPEEFHQGITGELSWKKYLVIKVLGEYEVESYQKNMHLLLKIFSKGFNSTFLLTTEENGDGVLVRIDHRGFHGENSLNYQKSFLRLWKKLQKTISIKK